MSFVFVKFVPVVLPKVVNKHKRVKHKPNSNNTKQCQEKVLKRHLIRVMDQRERDRTANQQYNAQPNDDFDDKFPDSKCVSLSFMGHSIVYVVGYLFKS